MDREQLLTTIKHQLGDINIALEIGVWRGSYSRSIIKNLQPTTFYGVDPYDIYEGYTDKPNLLEFQNNRSLEELYNRVMKTFKTFNTELSHTNSKIIREMGTNYAPTFADNTIDFVYLDSDHKYESVKSEINAWYPKVKVGGILAGHDYIARSHIEEFGVIPAVTEFIERENLTLHTTDEEFSSWWVTKT